ncbi:UNVERIFIED_CONTAM: hypothetical protein Scaly_2220400 [Sesamum calycinum]|uniref:Uncharacterized protein n=1 Tax=Sesamum calycinum TaxID=2727403 RepID=A0AAW2MBV3_9LAMI
MYYAAANGLAEAFNKTLCNLLKKVVAKSKRDWHERIGEALWAYRTTVRTPTQTTPYALVYGPELLPYHNYAKRLIGWLGDVELEHLSRKDNKQADALAKLASTLSMTDKEAHIPICKSWVIPPIFSDDEDDMLQEEENHVTEVFEVEEEDWRQPLVDYLKCGK